MISFRKTILVFVLSSTCVTAAYQTGQYVSVNNPFVKDASAIQLPSWAISNQDGHTRRTTTGSGNPLPSNTASLAVQRISGQSLLFDPVLANKLSSFNRERIPERPVHAKGHGAFGHFVVTHDVSKYTKAKVFNVLGKVTPIFVRFSSTNGGSSSADTTPDARGFAIRFYTEDGNLDFPGLLIDALAFRDPMLFPDLNRSNKKNPQTHANDPNMYYDFLSLRTELVHQWIKFNADYTRPGSVRAMNGSSVNVNTCVTSEGESFYCKFAWQSQQPMPPLSDDEAMSLAGSQPDYYTQELYNSIAMGNFPKWTFGMQALTLKQADALPFNPLDVTKVWRMDEIPFIPIGIFVLDKNPTDFFTQVEQAALDPGNMVPGIGLSPDPILMARTFAYKDAQRYRLGTNFELIEVNRPLSRVEGYERDGAMRLSAKDNGDGGPVYYPNSFNGPEIDPEAVSPVVERVTGFASRVDTGNEDNFSQAKQFLEQDVGTDERYRIAGRIAVALDSVLPPIRARVLVNCIYPLGRQFGDLVVKSLQALEKHKSYSNYTSANIYGTRPIYYNV